MTSDEASRPNTDLRCTDVTNDAVGGATGLTNVSDDLRQCLAIAGDQHHVGATGGECKGQGATESAAGSSN